MYNRQKYKKQKVYTYISVQDIERLKLLCMAYGFKSTYQILQYLLHCFLRVVDPENDTIDEPIQQEIVDMFINNADWQARRESNNTYFEDMQYHQRKDQRTIKSPDDLVNR